MSVIDQRRRSVGRDGPSTGDAAIYDVASSKAGPGVGRQANLDRRSLRGGRTLVPGRNTVLVGAAAGVLAGAGALGGHWADGAGRAVATLVVGWLALTYALALPDSSRTHTSGPSQRVSVTTMSTTHLARFVDQAMLALVAITIASLVTHSFERSAAEMLLAAPLGLTLYVVVEAMSTAPSSDVRKCVLGAICGSAAALFSGQAINSKGVSTPLLAGLLLVAVLGLIIARRSHERTARGSAIPASAWLIGGAVAALATGIAANPLALLTISAPLVSRARWWRERASLPTGESSTTTSEATSPQLRAVPR